MHLELWPESFTFSSIFQIIHCDGWSSLGLVKHTCMFMAWWQRRLPCEKVTGGGKGPFMNVDGISNGSASWMQRSLREAVCEHLFSSWVSQSVDAAITYWHQTPSNLELIPATIQGTRRLPVLLRTEDRYGTSFPGLGSYLMLCMSGYY